MKLRDWDRYELTKVGRYVYRSIGVCARMRAHDELETGEEYRVKTMTRN